MERVRHETLTVEVRLLSDPPLWCWEIRDPGRGAVVESSWSSEWKAFGSAEEAYTAGCHRLTMHGDR